MPGQAQPVVRLLGIVAVAFVAVVLPAFGEPNPSNRAASLAAENAQLEAKSRSAVLDLYSLDARLAAASAHVAFLRTELGRLRAVRATLRRELQIARAGEQISEQQLATRLRQLYDQGDVSALEVVFGASSLSDAMTQLDNMNRVASLNDEVISELRSARTRYVNTAHRLVRREREVAAAVSRAAAAEASLAATRAARASYVASLAAQRALNTAQIARLDAAARAAEARAQLLTHATPAAAVATPVVAATPELLAGKTLTVTITGYALPGHTATGVPVGWGVAAVDPHVIPLGTHLYVPGYGTAVAADVGSAIVGNRVDLWFPSVAQAQGWGLRSVTIALH